MHYSYSTKIVEKCNVLFRIEWRTYWYRSHFAMANSRGAESKSESESHGVVVTNQESESESIKLP